MRADARAVVDTNVLISAALLAGSVPARLVRHLLHQIHLPSVVEHARVRTDGRALRNHDRR